MPGRRRGTPLLRPPADAFACCYLRTLMPSCRAALAQGGDAPAVPPSDTPAVRVGALALGIMSRLIQVVRMLHQVGWPVGPRSRGGGWPGSG